MSGYLIVSDVHGNLPALERVWKRAEGLGITNNLVFNAGDSVAYGDQSASCIDFFRSKSQILTVAGNYDCHVALFPQDETKFERKWKVSRPAKFEAIRNASNEISPEQRHWLESLPELLELSVESRSVSLSHYSPLDKKRGLGSWTTDDELRTIADACNYDIVIVGHTHTPFVRKQGNTLFINPGSVGRAWGNPTFAVLTMTEEEINCEVMT